MAQKRVNAKNCISTPMPFEAPVLPTCPACQQPGIRVRESRPNAHGTRRRKACDHCGHRFTTYEVSAEFYRQAEDNIKKIMLLRQTLGAPMGEHAVQGQNPCGNCVFNVQDGQACAYGLPEYDSVEAADCNYFTAG
jgi:hypothetical protein